MLRRQGKNRSEIIRKVWVLPKCESSYLTFRAKALRQREKTWEDKKTRNIYIYIYIYITYIYIYIYIYITYIYMCVCVCVCVWYIYIRGLYISHIYIYMKMVMWQQMPNQNRKMKTNVNEMVARHLSKISAISKPDGCVKYNMGNTYYIWHYFFERSKWLWHNKVI